MKKTICLLLSLLYCFWFSSCNTVQPVEHIKRIPSESSKIFSDFIDRNLEENENGNISFMHLIDKLYFNGKLISETSSPKITENKTGISERVYLKDAYEFKASVQTTESGTIVESTYFYLKKDISRTEPFPTGVDNGLLYDGAYGIDLPFGINNKTSIEDMLQRLGADTYYYEGFVPDKFSETEMTLYSDDKSSIVYIDLNRTSAPVDYMTPYRIVFTEEYTTSEGKFAASLTLHFDLFSKKFDGIEVEAGKQHIALQ